MALVAGAGAERLRSGGRVARSLLAILCVLGVLQFVVFSRDYFGPYRERASTWFGGNIRGALLSLVEEARRTSPATIYISSDIPWVEAYWRFYTTVAGERPLLDHTRYVRLASDDLPASESGAVLVAPAVPDYVARLSAAGWRESERVADLDGSAAFVIMRGRQ
jgi:hypothetical protein